jgi:hypothetical protein
MTLAHDAARQKDQEVNREIAEYHNGDRASRQYGRAKRYGSEHCGQRCLINMFGFFDWVVGGARLIDWHASHPGGLDETTNNIYAHMLIKTKVLYIGQKQSHGPSQLKNNNLTQLSEGNWFWLFH